MLKGVAAAAVVKAAPAAEHGVGEVPIATQAGENGSTRHDNIYIGKNAIKECTFGPYVNRGLGGKAFVG